LITILTSMTLVASSLLGIEFASAADSHFPDPLYPPDTFTAVVFDTPTVQDGSIFLPVCGEATQTNCVEGLSVGSTANNQVPSQYLRMAVGNVYPVDHSMVSLWQNSNTNVTGNNLFAVAVSLSMRGGNYTTSLSAQVVPYREDSGNYSTSSGHIAGCVWTSSGYCGRVQDFSPETVVSLTIRVSNKLGGWFSGRLQDPSITVAPIDSTSNRLTVEIPHEKWTRVYAAIAD
jgi:hypothetical protein